MRTPFLSRLAAAVGGASAIEFALVSAFLIAPLTLGLYDVATALYRWMEVGNAARAGAQFINVNGYQSTYSTSGQTCSNASSLTFTCAVQHSTSLGTNVSASVGAAYCGCQNGTTFNVEGYAPPCNSCSDTYLTNCCPAGQTPVTMAKVEASYDYKPIFNYLGFGPSNGFNLTAQSTALIY